MGVCEPFTSESFGRNLDQTYELTYEHSSAKSTYESNVRLHKAIRNISDTTDQAMISNQNTLVAQQNKMQ